jgi:hypothetical protein
MSEVKLKQYAGDLGATELVVRARHYDALTAQRDEGLAREAELCAALRKARSWIESARDGVLYPIARDFDGVVGRNAEGLGQMTPGLLDAIDQVLASPDCADGESAECAHSYANKLGCPECGEDFGK